MNKQNSRKGALYSISDMMNLDKRSIEDKIFVTNNFSNCELLNNEQYVKLKRANYIKNKSFHTVFQIIDISDSIRLYYE